MKPMLAANAELSQLTYPLYASPKLDGVRGLVIDGVLHSRSLKKFPNPHVHARFSTPDLDGLDGELILGDPTAKDVYRVTNGACARQTGTPDVKFYVFDFWHRFLAFENVPGQLPKNYPHVVPLPQHWIEDETELLRYERDSLDLGYEGLILRSPNGLYKFGRSTVREGGMLKLKRFTDSEAEILEVLEEEHNANEAKKNELGRTQRSTAKAGMVKTGRAGALRVRDIHTQTEFSIGTGMNDEDREFFWKNRKKVVGTLVKYKHFEVGAKDLPRFPVFLGLREKWDMS